MIGAQVERLDTPVGRVLAKAGKTQRAGKGWLVCCPAHADSSPSLSVTEGRDGRALLKCHEGCEASAILEVWGMGMSDLYPERAEGNAGRQPETQMLTVIDFAKVKGLPIERLAEFGVVDGTYFERPCVEFRYSRLDGGFGRTRLRRAMGKEGFRWKDKDGDITAYTPDRCELAREEQYAVLAEGESDTLTLLIAGVPAIGFPGANTARVLTSAHLEGLARVFIVQEPEAGGATFVTGVSERLCELGYAGAVHVLRMPVGVKDPSSLYLRDRAAFEGTFHTLMKAATEPPRPKYLLLSEMVKTALKPIGQRLTTGFPTLDAAVRGGIPLGRMVMINGAPGAGKSTLAVQLAHTFEQQGCAVVYLADDESAEGIITRLGQLVSFSREGLESDGDAGDSVRAEFAKQSAGRMLAVIDPDEDDSMCTIEDAGKALEHLAGEHPRVLIVDSLQTAQCLAAAGLDSERERIGAKLKILKAMQKRGVLVIAISEMSRAAYRSGDRKQNIGALASGKESGSIEYAAQLLLGLRSVKDEPDQVDVEVAKNRLGADKPELRFKLDFARARLEEVAGPQGTEKGAWEDERRSQDVLSKVRSAVLKHPGRLDSKNKIIAAARVKKAEALRAIDLLEVRGELECAPDGFYRLVAGGGSHAD